MAVGSRPARPTPACNTSSARPSHKAKMNSGEAPDVGRFEVRPAGPRDPLECLTLRLVVGCGHALVVRVHAQERVPFQAFDGFEIVFSGPGRKPAREIEVVQHGSRG